MKLSYQYQPSEAGNYQLEIKIERKDAGCRRVGHKNMYSRFNLFKLFNQQLEAELGYYSASFAVL